jgi:hypothetical protein
MVRNSKCGTPSGTSRKQSSPRQGEKMKQSKVTMETGMESKAAQQTKLSFLVTGQKMGPKPPQTAAMPTTAITPDARDPLMHPSPPPTPAQLPMMPKTNATVHQKT